jgi:hypothetical protein
MRVAILTAVMSGGLSACSAAMLASPSGQLFCALQTDGGGSVVVGLIDAEASALLPGAAPVAVLAAGAAQADLDAACAAAAASVGGTGMAVPAPTGPVPNIPIKPITKGT